jgi:hypothetical protein
MGLMLDQVPHGRKLAQYENMTEPLPCPLCNASYETLEHVIFDCPALSATRAVIKEVAFHPYLLQGNPRSSSSRPLPKPIKQYMNLLLRHAFTGDALSSDVEAVAIWLARPQNTTLGQVDQATNAEFGKDNQQRLRKELLKAVPHLTRSARQLWQERCQKASIINGTGTGPPSPMTVSAYSSGTYVSTMTDFFEARSTGVEDPPTSSSETGHDVCLFSPSSNDQPRDFSYSKTNRRMEVRTRGPLDPGKYEALVNYDDPHYPSGYWTKERRNLLPPKTLARLEATYPAKIRASRKIPGGSKSGRLGLPTCRPQNQRSAPTLPSTTRPMEIMLQKYQRHNIPLEQTFTLSLLMLTLTHNSITQNARFSLLRY